MTKIINVHELITEFKGTTFHENYRATDWLLNKFMEIERETESLIEKKDKEIKRLNKLSNQYATVIQMVYDGMEVGEAERKVKLKCS